MKKSLKDLLDLTKEGSAADLMEFGIESISSSLDTILKSDLLSKTAKLHKKYFDQLVEEGFSRSEAIILVSKFKMPGGE